MISYSKFTPIKPPRPETSVPPELLSSYERRGYRAQVKKNGQYSVVYAGPRGELRVLNRHLEEHKNWKPDRETLAPLLSHSKKGWTVFCCELLHGKVPGIRDVHYVHDVVVQDGQWLLGETYAERYLRLQKMLMRPGLRDVRNSHWVVTDHVWLAKMIRSGFADVFESLENPEDEGLVLKNPSVPLDLKTRWSVKCRRPAANYSW